MTLLLRDFTDEDMVLLERWLYLPHVAKWFEQPLDWLDEARNRHTTFHWLRHYMIEWQKQPIGFCQYYPYDKSGEDWQGTVPLDGTYSIDYLIGEAGYLRKGLGKKALRLLLQKIALQGEAKRVIAQPDPENEASCNLLLAAGFQYDPHNRLYLYEMRNKGSAE